MSKQAFCWLMILLGLLLASLHAIALWQGLEARLPVAGWSTLARWQPDKLASLLQRAEASGITRLSAATRSTLRHGLGIVCGLCLAHWGQQLRKHY